MGSRLKKTRKILEGKNLDGLIVSWPANISYLTKTISRESYLLVSPKENLYFTDSRYTEEAKKSLKGIAKLKKINGSLFKMICSSCFALGLKRIGFEEKRLPYSTYKKIKSALAGRARLLPTSGLVEELRQVKEPEELEKIRKATRIAVEALKYMKESKLVGKKEIEVVADLERFIRYQGASNSSFDIIVASGPNSSLPHHIPGKRKIRKNEPVLIDLGVDCDGYKSDLTRVFFSGKIKGLFQKVYDIVLEAKNLALKKIRPAAKTDEVDAASRQYITQKGFGGYFGHSLGHGIGLEVHEEPRISGKESKMLKRGMVFTVEPAIYLPGKFGVRLEDMVLVTQQGYEVLSGALNK